MRLIKLSFKNLNSLLGTWSIDFDHPAYRGDGIFAISGPTGAGKSSILDAICLALYKASPRLKEVTKGSNELMSRGTGDCFSELTFETRGRRLTARFAQSRARSHPEGALQDATWTLSENGRLISDKARDTKIQIEAVLSLDFDQFTRAILLAQGNFAAFLKASPAEQADLLEKMTGTEIYQQIGEEIHDITAEKRQALEHCDTLLGGHISLSDDERADLAAAIDEHQLRLAELNLKLKSLTDHQAWQRRLLAATAEVAAQEAALAAASQHQIALAAELAPLLRQDACSRQLDLAAQTFRHQQDERQKLLLQKNQAAEAAILAERALLKSAESLSTTQTECGQRKTLLQQERLDLQQLREMVKEEAAANTSTLDLERKLKLASATAQAAKEEVERQQKNRQNLLTEEDDLELYQRQHAVDARLAASLPLLDNQFKAWQRQLGFNAEAEVAAKAAATIRQQAVNAEKKLQAEALLKRQEWQPLEAAFKLKEASRNELIEIRSEESLQQRLEQLREQSGQVRQQLSQAEQRCLLKDEKTALLGEIAELQVKLAGLVAALPIQEKLVAEKLAAIEQEQERKILLDRIASLEAHRQALSSGQPCPLCGSEEHPYAHQIPAATSPDALRRYKAEHKAESQRLEALAHQRSGAEIEAKLKNERLVLVERQLAILPAQDLPPLLAKLEELEQERQNLTPALQQLTSLRLEIEALRPKLNASEKTLQMADEKLLAAQTRLQQTEQDLRLAQDELKNKLALRQTQESELLAALAPFLVIDAAGLSPELLPLLLRRSQLWDTQARRRQSLALLLATATEQLTHAAAADEKGHADLRTAEAALKTAQEILRKLRQNRQLRFADKQPQAEELRLDKALEKEEKRLRDASALHSAAATSARLAASRRDELHDAFTDGEAIFLASEAKWRQNLAAAGFVDDAARLAVQLPPAQRADAESRLHDAAAAAAKARSLLEAAQSRLLELRLETWPETSDEELAGALEAVKIALDEQRQQLGADKQKLGADELARRRHGDLLAQRQAAADELAPWDLTKSCIDSKDGLKRFAQGLTLERLLGLANQHLLRLRPRYQLSRENELIRIIDTHHGDAVRPIANLSGGESFLVSLALALGLSDMASRKIELGCLFLDEGFGTLDADSLQQALDALSHLQQHTGKLIGLISHIDSLKEVLPVQIRVNPVGRGRSEISGPGVEMTAAPAPSVSRSPPLASDIHAQVLGLLDQHPSLKSSLLQEQLKITPSQASKVLKELVESGQLRSEGKGKGMIYLADRIEST